MHILHFTTVKICMVGAFYARHTYNVKQHYTSVKVLCWVHITQLQVYSSVLILTEAIKVVHTGKRVFLTVLLILVFLLFCWYGYIVVNQIVLTTVHCIRNSIVEEGMDDDVFTDWIPSLWNLPQYFLSSWLAKVSLVRSCITRASPKHPAVFQLHFESADWWKHLGVV